MPAADRINPDASLWHWLAYDLRRYRLARGESATKVAGIMGCSRAHVSNFEAMNRRPSEKNLKPLDGAWRTNGHFVRIFTFARRDHNPNWYVEHLHYEARAHTVRMFEGLTVPGLLQTEDYARVAISAEGDADVDKAVADRMARQAILTRNPPTRLSFLLDECVIDRPVGGPAVMRAQLARLLELSHLPNVTIRIVPRNLGYHVGLSGAFEIMGCDPEGDVGYTEACEGGRLVLDSVEARRFVVRFEEIGADALSRPASRDLIRRVMETME
ncbi:helix-turn-helix transcriptional regulator [Actinoallomurus oryzae]|uniref:Helix-turn-helix transcriptional regulator n=1 Tax=Actinoallomurus oryzae TaxID=502180 RepID=A0ABP8QYU0_9ACTN